MKNESFIKLYKSLPKEQNIRSVIRNKIIEECNINRNTFYNWLSGVCYVPIGKIDIISKIVDVPKEQLFPIEITNNVEEDIYNTFIGNDFNFKDSRFSHLFNDYFLHLIIADDLIFVVNQAIAKTEHFITVILDDDSNLDSSLKKIYPNKTIVKCLGVYNTFDIRIQSITLIQKLHNA